MARAPVSPAELLKLSAAFGNLGDAARSVLSDDAIVLSVDQSNLVSSDMSTLYNVASNVATWAASIEFEDAAAAFAAIDASTASGCASLRTLQADATKVDKIVSILAASVSLGVALGSGNVGSILGAASSLKSAAA